MATDASLARIFGSDADAVYLAPIGTAVPTSLDEELDVAFEDVGWIHSDGITETATGSKSVIRGHQGGGVVRTIIEESGTTVAFTALETKAQTNELRYNVKESTSATGVRTEKRGAGQKVSARVAVLDFFDADDVTIAERWIIDRFEIVPDGDRVMVNNDIAGYPFSGEIIGDYTVLATDPAYVEA